MDEKIPPPGGQLPLRVLRKAVLFLAIVTVFAGLFGCSARPEPPAGEPQLAFATFCSRMTL